MVIVGSIVILAIFLLAGWAVTVEMFQQRSWRRKVASGDVRIIVALIEEALSSWRGARPPKGVPSALWAGVQGAQLVAVTADSATVSSAAEGEFRTEGDRRVMVASALDEGISLAARLVDMMLYDVPNLRLGSVRVDIYSTFSGTDGAPVQRPILTTTASRAAADAVDWEGLTPEEVLGRFDTRFERTASGQPAAIDLPPVEGEPPQQAAPQGEAA
jgi:hypothetical protein